MGIATVTAFHAIIVAAGSGSRAGGDIPKQYRDYQGQPLLRHSVRNLLSHPLIGQIIVVIGAGQDAMAQQALPQDDRIKTVLGGDSRMASVANGLQALSALEIAADTKVLVHDAARPGLSHDVIDRLLLALDEQPGAVPVLPMVDSMTNNAGELLGEAVDRNDFVRVQTPQAFHFHVLQAAHQHWQTKSGDAPTDDARMVQDCGYKVAAVAGDEKLAKITFAEDFDGGLTLMNHQSENLRAPIRIGNGFDVHRFEPGDHIWLCGVQIPHKQSLKGHSDADVGLHALTDALLGALALGDIGDHFPDTDPQWAGSSSDRFLEHAANLVEEKGYRIGNVDITLICEAPKVKPHREAMRERVAAILSLDADLVSIKATTTEALGFTGRREGIAAQASATLIQHSTR
ncbi:bifunctional 2-C-methyl-D-erythritol 4-phosphate cytidylyltransferase/2-C-methyl-D-erythritol 2,4-cyclodiphosphate synthase [Alterisphingorhabdus coralli]|uniref:Bifunctional enzyme IspD/IspF n=1 Tax=Alterisphingorhabdus coralli TaxID=3071408 RepID=A0AA97F4V4_9SPHN|nr:bifunctional 2-C-methyl-D-erythritol 4-phosphate cytidylyltransferase/2-C-methyl-D-erythritol 2,4-cyclodiphosphate synthase [Parasphingorhabdus sp. SCSIO 66989]WOE74056.1 bifunctional 2-C-methyl-D-erythritol 4-phosphate cytidylyltransferase/2-C-methyl-D-erythritol 2,4-cyclodiphosphate synthase [Parasphingorhabdus sp. SCSIO 66989]